MFKRLLKSDYTLSAVNKLVAVLTNAVYAALVNRALGPALKGEYTYILNVVEIVVIIANLGFYQSYPKNFKEHMPNVKRKYISLFSIQFAVYLLVAVICGIASGSLLYAIIFLLVPMQMLATQLSMITLIECIQYRQYIQIISQLLKVLMVVLLYIFFPKNLLCIFGILLVFNLFQTVSYYRKLRCIPNPVDIDVVFIKGALSFGLFAMVSTLLLLLNYKLDVMMLKMFVDYRQIGLYSVGAALSESIWLIPDIFKEVLFARTSRSDAIEEINMAIKISMFASAAAIIIMLILGKWVLLIYAGEEYLSAYRVTCILFLGIPSMALFKVTNPLYQSNGRQKLLCAVLTAGVVANILMNVLLIPVFGIEGAAVATVVSFSVCGLTFYIKYIRDYNIKWYEPLLLNRRDIAAILRIITEGRNTHRGRT